MRAYKRDQDQERRLRKRIQEEGRDLIGVKFHLKFLIISFRNQLLFAALIDGQVNSHRTDGI